MPSSFHSTAAGLSFASAAAMSGGRARRASGGRGRPTCSRNARERLGAARQRDRRDGAEVAAQHQRAPQRRRRGRRRPCAAASAITPASAPWRRSPDSSARRNALLGARSRGRTARPARRGARACEPGPGQRADRARTRRRRRRRVSDGVAAGGGSVAQRRPADADLALAQLAGQERDGDRGLLGRGRAQRVGERGDLAAARARGADGLGGGDEVGEQQPTSCPTAAGRSALPSDRASARGRRWSFFISASRSAPSSWKYAAATICQLVAATSFSAHASSCRTCGR